MKMRRIHFDTTHWWRTKPHHSTSLQGAKLFIVD